MHMDQKSKQELRSWIFPILMLIFVTPLGVLLIVLKLLGGGSTSRSQRRDQRAQGFAALPPPRPRSARRSPAWRKRASSWPWPGAGCPW